MGPRAESDGHDFPGAIDERIPGEAAMIEDVGVGFEAEVREPVHSRLLPDIFDRIEFRALRWQRHNGDVGGNEQSC